MTRLEKQLQKCREGGGVELDLSGLDISDLTPFVTEFPNLQVLYVSSTQVNDLSPLKDLVNLQVLSVYSTQVTDFSVLDHLTEDGLKIYK